MKKLLGIILFLVGILVAIQSLNLWDQSMTFSFSNDETNETKQIDVNGVKSIAIDVSSSEINIIPEDRNNVEVHFYSESSGNERFSAKRSGNSIDIQARHDFGWFNLFNLFNKLTMDVYIPASYDEELSIDTSSGKVELIGPSGDPVKLKKLSIDISSGSVYLQNLVVDDFRYDSSSGKLEADTLHTNRSNIDVSSGKIVLDHFSGELKGEASSGSLTVQYDQFEDFIDWDTSSGSINIDLPDDVNFTLNASASVGNIKCEFPILVTKKDNNDLKGTVGDGTYPINLHVSSGKIYVY